MMGVPAERSGLRKTVHQPQRPRALRMPAEAVEGYLIRQLNGDHGMAVGRRVIGAIADPLHAGNAGEQLPNIAQRQLDLLATDSRLDAHNDVVPNHLRPAAFSYRANNTCTA